MNKSLKELTKDIEKAMTKVELGKQIEKDISNGRTYEYSVVEFSIKECKSLLAGKTDPLAILEYRYNVAYHEECMRQLKNGTL